MDNILFCIALSLLVGISLSYMIKPAMLVVLISLFLALLLLFLYRKSKAKLVVFCALILFIGMGEYAWFASLESKLDRFGDKTIEIEALILDNGIEKSSGIIYNAETKTVSDDKKIYNYKERILFKNYGKTIYKAGDVVRARGQAVGFINRRNFGDQDYGLYNRSRGIYNQFASRDNKLIKSSANNYKVIFLYGLRNRIAHIINSSMPREEAAFLNAVILGDKQWIDERDMINLQKTGLSHLLSVSGLHVSFIALMLNKLFDVLRLDKKIKGLLSGFLLIYYVMLIGAPPPAVRALIMMLVIIAGKNMNREYDLLSSVSFAAIIMLIFNPMLIHNLGFIISYGCIYSIVFLYDPIYKKIKSIPVPPSIIKSVSLSVAVQIGISPILIHSFQYFSMVNVFINIIAVPLTFAILAIGFAGVAIGIFFPTLSIYVLASDYYLISFLLKIVHMSADMIFAGFSVSALPIYIYVIYYLSIIFIINRDNGIGYHLWKWKFHIYMTAIFLITLLSIKYITNKDMRVVLLDVGQGDAILITTPKGKNILVDGGGSGAKGCYYYDIGSKITVPALRKLGVWGLDTIILSHCHEDHLEGLIKVASEFKVKNVLLPKVDFENESLRSLIDVSKIKGSRLFYVNENDKLILENDVFINILSPQRNIIMGTSSDENNNSIVFRLVYKNFTMLFTGDIQEEAEVALAGKHINSVVLKVPHHGSSTSSSKGFIEEVSPKISLISVGQNTYGHPSYEAMENIEEVGSKIYRTDNNGAIKIISDGLKLKIDSVR